MVDRKQGSDDARTTRRESNWGSKLFLGTLLVVLAFFWWLLIYSGGVSHAE